MLLQINKYPADLHKNKYIYLLHVIRMIQSLYPQNSAIWMENKELETLFVWKMLYLDQSNDYESHSVQPFMFVLTMLYGIYK